MQRRLGEALSGLPLTFVHSARELRGALATQRFCLIVFSLAFEESTSLELIGELRRRQPQARIVCVRGTPFNHVGKPAMEAFRLACEALGVEQVIDLLDYPDDAAGNRAIRALFARQLADGPSLDAATRA